MIEKDFLDIGGIRWSDAVVWSKLTSLGVGLGTAVVAEPEDDSALSFLLKLTSERSVPVIVIGSGTNLVGADASYDGIVIRLSFAKFAEITFGRTTHVTVGAGISLSSFLKKCVSKGLGGFAGLASIPGTLGGALRVNAGADGVEASDFVTELFGHRLDGSYWSAEKEEVEWGYRFSAIPEDVVLTGAICRFCEVDPECESRGIVEALARRKTTQPSGRSAGCVFKNPSSDLSAGWLIDRAGCKGLSKSELTVSGVHANFVVNEKTASTEDFLQLAIEMKRAVFADSGVILQPELRFVSNTDRIALENCMEAPKVVVLKGGDSNEREVSLHSAEGVEKALVTAGCDVVGVDLKNFSHAEELFAPYALNSPVSPENSHCDAECSSSHQTTGCSASAISEIPYKTGEFTVFPVLHGGFGEDGRLQALLERLGIPFVGCSSTACDIAMDKVKSKDVMRKRGIPTPKYAVLDSGDFYFPKGVTLPLVVKPPEEGSTVGISLVKSMDGWEPALREAYNYSDRALVEEFVEGVEITVGVVGGEALPVIEIRFPGEMFDYDAKYDHELGETLYLCPPETVSEELQNEAQRLSLEFADAIDSSSLSRIDLIIGSDGIPMVIEANNLPGFTSSSLLPKAAARARMPFPVLCAKLLQNV